MGRFEATSRHPPTVTESTIISGGKVAKLAWVLPPDGRPMARNPATPAAVAATPPSITRSARGPPGRGVCARTRSCQEISTAKIRSRTRSGCTSARLPKLSATICSANPTMFATMASSHSGWRISSRKIRGDSERVVCTRFVLR